MTPFVLACAPLVVIPGLVDFALLPQQAFVAVMALAMAMAWLGREAPAAPARRLGPLDLSLAAFLAASALSLAATPDRGPGLRILACWGACGIVYVVVSRGARRGDVSHIAAGALCGGAAAATVGLAQALIGFSAIPQAVGPAATMANRNLAAGYLAAVAPLALVGFRARWARWAAGGAAFLILAYLPFTASRGAVLAVALQLVLLAAFGRSSGWRVATSRRIVSACAVTVAALVALAGLTLSDSAKVRSLGIRGDLGRAALAMALDRPLTGVGLGRFEAAYPAYGPVVAGPSGGLRVQSAHGELLHVFAETGVPGLLALAWVLGAAATLVVRLQRSGGPARGRAALALGLSLTGLAADGAFGSPLGAALPPLLAAAVLGLLRALEAPVACSTPALARVVGVRPVRWAVVAAVTAALAASVGFSLLRIVSDRALYVLRVAERAGRPFDALTAGHEALSLDPRPAVLLAVARAELRVGHAGAATALLERLLEAQPLDATAMATLGVARWLQGDVAAAAATLRLARLLGAGPAREPPGSPGPEVASEAAECPEGVSLETRDGLVHLSARHAPLSEVLRCVSMRTGARLDYEGPEPRSPVTLDIEGQPIAATVQSLFEGLGIDYVLSLDASGTNLTRLIVFSRPASGGSPGPAARPGSAAAPGGRAEPPIPHIADEPGQEGGGAEAPIQPETPAAAPGLFVPDPGGGGEAGPPPEYPDPGQLSPTVLQLGPGPLSVRTIGSPVRYAPVAEEGA